MKFIVESLLIALFAASLAATPLPIVVSDPGGYGGTTPGAAQNNGDVIGLLKYFDIDAIRFTIIDAMQVEAVIRVNYHNGDANLDPFSIGGGIPTLKPADLLFDVDGIYTYGVPLSGHDCLIAGALYQVVNGQPFVKDAKTVLNYGSYSSTNFRPSEPVWIKASHAQLVGDNLFFDAERFGSTSAVDITIRFTPTGDFLRAVTDGVSVHFASATCANDVLYGRLQYAAVPEPAAMALTGGGLLAVGLYGLRRRRRG
jgi:hypothetical protein